MSRADVGFLMAFVGGAICGIIAMTSPGIISWEMALGFLVAFFTGRISYRLVYGG